LRNFPSIGAKLKQIRELRNMSRNRLSDLSGVKYETIVSAEENNPVRESTVAALSKALGVTVRELMDPATPDETQFLVFLDELALMPAKAHAADAGFDLFSPQPDMVPARGSTVINTGVHVAIPEGYAGLLVSKSGLSMRHGLISDGLIDAGYTGPIHVKLYNLNDVGYLIERGDKISQLVFIPIAEPCLVESALPLPETERGDRGFGSSGR
jgi:dUTP pyrophosphatase